MPIAEAQTGTRQVRGVNIFERRIGQGPPVVVLHGGPEPITITSCRDSTTSPLAASSSTTISGVAGSLLSPATRRSAGASTSPIWKSSESNGG